MTTPITYHTFLKDPCALSPELAALATRKGEELLQPRWSAVQNLFAALPQRALPLTFQNGSVCIGDERALSEEERGVVLQLLDTVKPWRKGPFHLAGIEIDAEWRSDLKWERMKGLISGERLIDIGCGNGYSLYRAAELGLTEVVGFEPYERYFFQYALFRHFTPEVPIAFYPAGYEHCPSVAKRFDTALCMGIVYHHRDPLRVIEASAAALRSGGQLIVETLAIPGEDNRALFPPERYARMKNVYFIPTPPCLLSWMARCGLKNIELVSVVPLTPNEQRPTKYSPGASLADFLDSSTLDDSDLKSPGCESPERRTVEGHPPPLRVVARGFRP